MHLLPVQKWPFPPIYPSAFRTLISSCLLETSHSFKVKFWIHGSTFLSGPQLPALPGGRCAAELAPECHEELLHPSNPDKDLDEKAARKITKYRELYQDHRRHLDFMPVIASTSGRIGSIASCCACCFYTRTGRRQASWRFGMMGMRIQTPFGLLTVALLSSTLSRARQVSW